MSTVYYGQTTVTCYNDCQQEGCPGHRVRLAAKHGAYSLEEQQADQSWSYPFGIPSDIGWVNAIAHLLMAYWEGEHNGAR